MAWLKCNATAQRLDDVVVVMVMMIVMAEDDDVDTDWKKRMKDKSDLTS